MLTFFVGCVITGWIIGWPINENRRTLSIITTLRNMSLSMVIAIGSFAGSQVVTTVLVYAFVSGSFLLLVSAFWRSITPLKNE